MNSDDVVAAVEVEVVRAGRLGQVVTVVEFRGPEGALRGLAEHDHAGAGTVVVRRDHDVVATVSRYVCDGDPSAVVLRRVVGRGPECPIPDLGSDVDRRLVEADDVGYSVACHVANLGL